MHTNSYIHLVAAIAVLLIEKDDFYNAQTSLIMPKRRCKMAKVLGFVSPYNKNEILKQGVVAHSMYDPSTIYEEDEYVKADDFNPDSCCECTAGIHYYLEFENAAAFGIWYTINF